MRQLLEKISDYVTRLFKEHDVSQLIYHNFSHTRKVVDHTREIMQHYPLSDTEQFIVLAAAWFHDTGHLFGKMKDHEKVSTSVMETFLTTEACPKDIVEQVTACILATRMPTNASRITEQILCDADTYHLGTTEFWEADEQVKKELQLREGLIVKDWEKHTIFFLQHHYYYTSYCRGKLDPGKLDNIAVLQRQISSTASK